ncbi:hypothetical protein AB0L86_00260 [Micromonospora musae]|uniref:hypothetical protein n=1 Tax=Micromonospora musae TaxID=1894970 RepID=UPI003434E5A9
MSYPPADPYPPPPGRDPYPPPVPRPARRQGGRPGDLPGHPSGHPGQQAGGQPGRGGYPGGPQRGDRPETPQRGYPPSRPGEQFAAPGGGYPESYAGPPADGYRRQPPRAPYPGTPPPGDRPPPRHGDHSGPPGGYPGRRPGPHTGDHPQPAAYPQQSGHPQQSSYAEQSGYAQQGSYPQQSGYPEQSGYAQQGSYAQQGGYPEQGGYPQRGGYAETQAGPHPSQRSEPVAPRTGSPPGDPEPAAPGPKKSRPRKGLTVAAAVLVLCLGGGAATWFVVKDDAGGNVEATRTRVIAPETLAGRPRIADKELQSVADQLVADMNKRAPDQIAGTVGAFYGDPAKRELAMIASASGLIPDPKRTLDDAIAEISPELTVTETAPVDPGPLGGEARCGDGKVDTTPLGVCFWADRGSVGAVVIYFKSAEQITAEFVTMRGEIEQSS